MACAVMSNIQKRMTTPTIVSIVQIKGTLTDDGKAEIFKEDGQQEGQKREATEKKDEDKCEEDDEEDATRCRELAGEAHWTTRRNKSPLLLPLLEERGSTQGEERTRTQCKKSQRGGNAIGGSRPPNRARDLPPDHPAKRVAPQVPVVCI
ncbi:hypothetical protein NDU88_001972 [Pleurodeles waltl]|uniref:Uncharacterized protein n=1 Tax=Pleurodeles waltl TaxID=8319 RepID=A0AAV7Q5E4_PLEWA|nr:hypothetical protein NDU88_001972 [Pleurodeles waltl]